MSWEDPALIVTVIAQLREEVRAWREEARRKDHIIAGLVERLPPQIEAPRDGRESTVTPAETPGRREEEAPEPERRSWLYRFFFGPG